MKNILLMLADDMGFGDLFRDPHPAYGPLSKINYRFRNQGTILQRYTCPSTICSPSRYGVVTGRDPAVDGVRNLIDNTLAYNDILGMPAGVPNLYRALKNAGYATGHFGKWHLGLDPTLQSVAEYGIDSYKGWSFPTNDPLSRDGLVGSEFVSVWGSGTNAEQLAALRVFDDQATAAAMDFIRGTLRAGQPFFVNLSFHAPHSPLNPPTASLLALNNLADKYGRPSPAQIYYAAIHRLAYNFDRLFSVIEAHNALNNTIMIFTADNGAGISRSAGNSADQWGCMRIYRGQKGETGNGGIMVPFGIRGPGIPAGRDHRIATVSGLDLAPSLCKMVGVPWWGAKHGEDRSAVFAGSDVERKGDLFWLSIQGDASTLDRIHRFPAFRGYFPARRVSIYLNLSATNQIRDLAIYNAGLNSAGKPIDPSEMQNLADPTCGQAGNYIAEITKLATWAVQRGAFRWVDPHSHGELFPDD